MCLPYRTRLPQLTSIFDNERRDEAEALIFLASFIKEIIKPAEKNGKEHVEYAPRQLFPSIFPWSFILMTVDSYLDGILYLRACSSRGSKLGLISD